jgi:hypothetical protein
MTLDDFTVLTRIISVVLMIVIATAVVLRRKRVRR